MRAGPSWPRSARECEQDRHGRGAPGNASRTVMAEERRECEQDCHGRGAPDVREWCGSAAAWWAGSGGGRPRGHHACGWCTGGETPEAAPALPRRFGKLAEAADRGSATTAARPRQRRPATAAAATAAALSGSTLVDTESNETCHEEALAGSARRSPEIASRRSTACPFSLSTGAAEKTWVMLRPLRLA